MAETPWGPWLSKVRQAGANARALSKPPAERANQFLEDLCDSQHVAVTLLWAVDREGRFQFAAGGGLARISVGEGNLGLDAATHLQSLREVFGEKPPAPVPWTAANGVTLFRVIRRVTVTQNTPLAIEIFFPMDRSKDTAGIDLAADEVVALLQKVLNGSATGPQVNTLNEEFWRLLDQFNFSLQRSLSVSDVAMVAANDGRVLLDCDRVSIAMVHGPRAKVVACSGQESTQQRANLIYQMSLLAKAVCDLGEPVLYTGTTDGFPESFREPLSKYLEESRSRMVHLIPLRENTPHHKTEQDLADQRRIKPARVIACLIAEQSKDSDPAPAITQRINMVSEHVATSLSNARNQEMIFLLPLLRTIGRTLGWFRGRRLAIALAILAAVGVLIGALSVVPWEYRFEATGRAMPSVQYDVFAPWDGNVTEVLVENGQAVKKDQIVVVLRSDDLDTELLAAKNMASEAKNKLINLVLERSRAVDTGRPEEVTRIDTEIATTEAQRDGAIEKAAMFEKRIQALQVRSPVDGVVATFQVKQNLLDRPVRRGDRLIEVMKVDGPWRLELDAPEYRMGHLQKAVIAKSGSTATPGQPALRQKLSEAEQLTVDYIAATDVGNRKQGKLAEIATRSNESQKEGSTIVELYVDINADDLPGRRIGAEVTAKVHCGKRSLGYVLFGDVWEFILRKVWW